jgi:uncharacterized protein
MELLLWTLAVALVLIGVIGVVLPALPGAALIFVGLLVAAWIDRFDKVGPVTLALLALLTVVYYVIDFAAAALGAKHAKAGKLAIAGAVVGLIVGLFFSLPGIILGPFIGAFAGEYIARRDLSQASRAGFYATLGLILGVAAKLTIACLMVGIFVGAYLL